MLVNRGGSCVIIAGDFNIDICGAERDRGNEQNCENSYVMAELSYIPMVETAHSSRVLSGPCLRF